MAFGKDERFVVPNWHQQARAADAAQRKVFEDLKRDGWVYDEKTHIWTHPLLPGHTIQE